MVLSMTGFARAEGIVEGKKITIDIRSLNSKNLDLNLKIPFRYKEKEFEIRKKLSSRIARGKVDFHLTSEEIEKKTETSLSKEVLFGYIEQLKEVVPAMDDVQALSIASKFPDVFSSPSQEVSKQEFDLIDFLLEKSLGEFQKFRQTEGAVLQKELSGYATSIEAKLSQVEPFEKERLETTKNKLVSALKEWKDIDEARFYQELAYYSERLDVSEEKVRLLQHCNYFQQVLKQEDNNGKKLGFISQEMGREINTLGSKANHPEIQKLVMVMKEDLEKIKEQALNVL